MAKQKTPQMMSKSALIDEILEFESHLTRSSLENRSESALRRIVKLRRARVAPAITVTSAPAPDLTTAVA